MTRRFIPIRRLHVEKNRAKDPDSLMFVLLHRHRDGAERLSEVVFADDGAGSREEEGHNNLGKLRHVKVDLFEHVIRYPFIE